MPCESHRQIQCRHVLPHHGFWQEHFFAFFPSFFWLRIANMLDTSDGFAPKFESVSFRSKVWTHQYLFIKKRTAYSQGFSIVWVWLRSVYWKPSNHVVSAPVSTAKAMPSLWHFCPGVFDFADLLGQISEQLYNNVFCGHPSKIPRCQVFKNTICYFFLFKNGIGIVGILCSPTLTNSGASFADDNPEWMRIACFVCADICVFRFFACPMAFVSSKRRTWRNCCQHDGILQTVWFSNLRILEHVCQFFFAVLSCFCQGVWDANMMAVVAYAGTLFVFVKTSV